MASNPAAVSIAHPSIPGARRGPLLHHLASFGRALHHAGVAADPAKLIDLARSLNLIDLADRSDFYAAARAIYVSRQDDLEIFDRVFSAYWWPFEREPATGVGAGLQDAAEDDDTPDCELTSKRESAGAGDDDPIDETAVRTAYSADERLMTKNLGQMSDTEIERARELMSELVAILATMRGRRTTATSRGSRLDLRRSMRKNLMCGRDGVKLIYRRRKLKKLRLMLLCDVSGSMERYSRFLIQFIYALRRELPEVDVGVFSTRMTVITELLDDRDVEKSLRRIAQTARDWGGGTDIGRCLREFNQCFARELLRSKTVMVILSDGWDRGDATRMRDELEHIHRQVHKLIWLNPLLGATGYEPLCRGIRTALPFMDYFLPAHNLESLAQLAKTLRSVWH